jgi:hypothetical protein
VADAAPQNRSLLVSAHARYGSFLPQNAARTRAVLVLGNVTRASLAAGAHRISVPAQDATIVLGRGLPFEAVVVVGGAHPRRTAITVNSIQYLPGIGLSATVRVEKRSRSALLRKRFPGAWSPPTPSFRGATLFAAPTRIRGLPGDFCFICDYPVTLEVHSTLPKDTVVKFDPKDSQCANSLFGSDGLRPYFDVTANPVDGDLTAFTAEATGGCFGKPSKASWQIEVVYPGKDKFFEVAWIDLSISQIGPQLYTTSCQTPKQSIHVRCTGRAVSSFEHTHIDLAP